MAFDLPDGGMFLWVRLTEATISARDLLPRAVEAGVAFVPGEAFHVDGSGEDHLRLSFATLTPEELAEAAGRLATALGMSDRPARPESGRVTGAISLRQLSERGVAELRGVGPKKLAALPEVGVDTVLDLLTTYPRRWVDRTNEARVSDLRARPRGARAGHRVAAVTKRIDPQPAHDGRRPWSATARGRMQVVFFNQPWREKQLQRGTAGRAVRQGRRLSRRRCR